MKISSVMEFLRSMWRNIFRMGGLSLLRFDYKKIIVSVVVGIIGVGMVPPPSLYLRWASIACGAVYFGYILHLIFVGKSFWRVVSSVAFVSVVRGVVEYNWLLEPFNFLPNSGGVGVIIAGVVAVVSMAVYVALFTGMAAGICWLVRCRVAHVRVNRMLSLLLFALLFATMEWIRGWLFTGFMWNPVAVMWTWSPKMMAVARFVRYFGMCVMTVVLLGMMYVLVPYVETRNIRMMKRYGLGIFILVAIWRGVGIWMVDFVQARKPLPNVRVVNVNIDQNMINDYYSHGSVDYVKNYVAEQYMRAIKNMPDWAEVDLFVLPETSSLYDLTNNAFFEGRYASMNNEKSSLIVGFNRYSDIDWATGDFNVYNSIGVVDKNGVQATYDKMHLVPFGEFVPMRSLLKMAKFTAGGRDFSAGAHRDILVVGELKLYPLLCYEAIFETDVPDGVDAIVTISNDAWFGRWGKIQHFEMAKFRAVEAGVPLIRAANMGISAIVDENGR